MNSFDLGKFQGNNIDIVYISYKISEASNSSLKDDFKVGHSYDKRNDKISLEINLTQSDPNWAGSSVQGELSISN